MHFAVTCQALCRSASFDKSKLLFMLSIAQNLFFFIFI